MKVCECKMFQEDYMSFHMHEDWCPMSDEVVSVSQEDLFQSGSFFEPIYTEGLDYEESSDYIIEFRK